MKIGTDYITLKIHVQFIIGTLFQVEQNAANNPFNFIKEWQNGSLKIEVMFNYFYICFWVVLNKNVEQATNCFNFTQRFQEIPNIALVSEFILELVWWLSDFAMFSYSSIFCSSLRRSASFLDNLNFAWVDKLIHEYHHWYEI